MYTTQKTAIRSLYQMARRDKALYDWTAIAVATTGFDLKSGIDHVVAVTIVEPSQVPSVRNFMIRPPASEEQQWENRITAVKTILSYKDKQWPYSVELLRKKGKLKQQVVSELIVYLNSRIDRGATIVTNAVSGFFSDAIQNLTSDSCLKLRPTEKVVDLNVLGAAICNSSIGIPGDRSHDKQTFFEYLRFCEQGYGRDKLSYVSLDRLVGILCNSDDQLLLESVSARNVAFARAKVIQGFLRHGRALVTGC